VVGEVPESGGEGLGGGGEEEVVMRGLRKGMNTERKI